MDKHKQATLETYNNSATELAEYFSGIGPRNQDIDHVFDLLNCPANPRVVEIGCGDGRDAKEILKYTSNYLGFDISSGMIDIARSYLPKANFLVSDAVDFEFPDNLDVVFAFASLLHLTKDEFQIVLQKVYKALKPNGIFYLSVKYASEYKAEIKKDNFGERIFYFYNESLIERLAGDGYTTASNRPKTVNSTRWVEMALRKKDLTKQSHEHAE